MVLKEPLRNFRTVSVHPRRGLTDEKRRNGEKGVVCSSRSRGEEDLPVLFFMFERDTTIAVCP